MVPAIAGRSYAASHSGVRGDELLRPAQVLRRVHRQPESLVAERAQPPLGGELGERRRLVVAPLGEPRERLLVEDVDAAVDPVRQPRRFAEADDDVVLVELDDPERRRQRRDRDRRRGAASPVVREQRAQVDVDELVAVQRVDRAALAPRARREAQPSPAPERLRLRDGDDLGAEAGELLARTAPSCPAAQLTITRVTPARASCRTW